MSKAWAERGRADVIKIDCVEVRDGETLRLTFEGVKSPWRQGVWLRTDGGIRIENQLCPSAVLWQDTAPDEVLIECRTQSGHLHLYNIWEEQGRRQSQMWASGMLAEELPNGRLYRCNDVGFEADFDKLVFRLEHLR